MKYKFRMTGKLAERDPEEKPGDWITDRYTFDGRYENASFHCSACGAKFDVQAKGKWGVLILLDTCPVCGDDKWEVQDAGKQADTVE